MPSSASRSLPSFPTRRSSDLAALRVFLGWLFMKGSHINPFYENSLLCRKYHKDFTSLAFVVSGKYHNLITFLNVQLFSRVILSGHNYNIYNTSGASETICIKFFSRSSLATGPKIRVPTGSFSLLIITAAFSSKRI